MPAVNSRWMSLAELGVRKFSSPEVSEKSVESASTSSEQLPMESTLLSIFRGRKDSGKKPPAHTFSLTDSLAGYSFSQVLLFSLLDILSRQPHTCMRCTRFMDLFAPLLFLY
uniref:(northern house mosquito) hypothetical protein n=1 Tax=Culex pipiens TaxID=7175 RepID=A0A8D8CVN8_CULPI